MASLSVDSIQVDYSAYVAVAGGMPQPTDMLYSEFQVGERIRGYSYLVPFSQALLWAKEDAVKDGVPVITMRAPR